MTNRYLVIANLYVDPAQKTMPVVYGPFEERKYAEQLVLSFGLRRDIRGAEITATT